MNRYSVKEIATALGADAFGAVGFLVERAAEPGDAGPDDLALAMDARYAPGLAASRARAAVLWPGADWQALGLKAAIIVPRARVAMAGITALFDAGPQIAPGIHSSAVVDPSASIGPGASIGPLVVVAAAAVIGAKARIASHSSIGAGVSIGDKALIHAGVHIQPGTRIGDDFIAQPGAVIGSDGFSFVTPEKSGVETVRETLGNPGAATAQSWMRIHSVGGVVIGNNVEIGAGSTVDQGTIRATRIGDGTKLDNQVHIGHNVVVGTDCLLCGQSGVAGSATVGNNVVLGGKAGVSDNISVGDGVIAGGATIILSNVPAGRVLLGYPAVKMDSHIETYKALRRLPRLFRDVQKLQKLVSKAEGKD